MPDLTEIIVPGIRNGRCYSSSMLRARLCDSISREVWDVEENLLIFSMTTSLINYGILFNMDSLVGSLYLNNIVFGVSTFTLIFPLHSWKHTLSPPPSLSLSTLAGPTLPGNSIRAPFPSHRSAQWLMVQYLNLSGTIGRVTNEDRVDEKVSYSTLSEERSESQFLRREIFWL